MALKLALLLAVVLLSACRPVPRLTTRPVLVPVDRHDIDLWPAGDAICVAVPPWQAVYVVRQCLTVAAIRRVILSTQVANDDEDTKTLTR